MKEIVINKPFNERIKIKFEKVKKEFEQNKKMSKDVNNLLKQKKYEEIYELYGKDVYVTTVPTKYLKKGIRKLLKEGRFEDIYLKYGNTYYRRYLPKMESIDRYLETGKKINFNKSLSKKIKKKFLSIFTSGVLLLEGAPAVLLTNIADSNISSNSREYAEDIALYDVKIKEYANNIRNLNLNDLEIIMKVMDDMWKSIQGYGQPQKDVFGYGRLDFLEDNGVGVCRNMADDFTAKMNAINPDYNARNLIVTLDLSEDSNFRMANIERKFVNIDNSNNSDTTETNESFLSTHPNIFGNHKVTLLDIPSDNITLMVDVTNPSIGVFVNGYIYSFATTDGKGWSTPILRQYIDGASAELNQNISIIKSYFQDNKDKEKLLYKWGVDAQNKALEKVRNIINDVMVTTNFNNSYQNVFSYEETNSLGPKLR